MKKKILNATRNDDTLEMSIYGPIGEDFMGNGITAAMVRDALSGDYKNVSLHIDSPGGDAFEGITIYNLLNNSGKTVNVVVDGLAASAASIIAMAGTTVTMNTGSQMMIHNAMGMGIGFASDLRKMAETLDSVSSGIADVYVNSTGLDKDEVLTMMENETWMDPTTAQEMGFATAVSKNPRVNNSFNLAKFKNVPKEFLVDTVIETPEAKVEEPVAEVVPAVKDEFDETELLLLQVEINKRR